MAGPGRSPRRRRWTPRSRRRDDAARQPRALGRTPLRAAGGGPRRSGAHRGKGPRRPTGPSSRAEDIHRLDSGARGSPRVPTGSPRPVEDSCGSPDPVRQDQPLHRRVSSARSERISWPTATVSWSPGRSARRGAGQRRAARRSSPRAAGARHRRRSAADGPARPMTGPVARRGRRGAPRRLDDRRGCGTASADSRRTSPATPLGQENLAATASVSAVTFDRTTSWSASVRAWPRCSWRSACGGQHGHLPADAAVLPGGRGTLGPGRALWAGSCPPGHQTAQSAIAIAVCRSVGVQMIDLPLCSVVRGDQLGVRGPRHRGLFGRSEFVAGAVAADLSGGTSGATLRNSSGDPSFLPMTRSTLSAARSAVAGWIRPVTCSG